MEETLKWEHGVFGGIKYQEQPCQSGVVKMHQVEAVRMTTFQMKGPPPKKGTV